MARFREASPGDGIYICYQLWGLTSIDSTYLLLVVWTPRGYNYHAGQLKRILANLVDIAVPILYRL